MAFSGGLLFDVLDGARAAVMLATIDGGGWYRH